MGYAAQTPSADNHLKEKIAQALIETVSGLVDPAATTGNAALANAINSNPTPAVNRLHSKVKAANAITVESTDAELTAAIFDQNSRDMLFQFYGVPSS